MIFFISFASFEWCVWCVLQKDVRDIFTPLYFDVRYDLGEHSVEGRASSSLTPLKAVLQQRDGQTNRVMNQVRTSAMTHSYICTLLSFVPHKTTKLTFSWNQNAAGSKQKNFLNYSFLKLEWDLFFIRVPFKIKHLPFTQAEIFSLPPT